MPTPISGHQLLSGRYSEVGRIYSVTVVTDRRQPVFSDFHVARLLVKQLKHIHDHGLVHSLTWVVMPDHLHWLFELKQKSIGEVMCRVKSRSSLEVNQACNTHGRLWQKGYYERAIRQGEDLKAIARYIVANPLRAGLVKQIGDYPLWDARWI